MSNAIQIPHRPIDLLNEGVRFTSQVVTMVAAVVASLTVLQLLIPLAASQLPTKDALPTGWWSVTLLGVVGVANAIMGGYFYAELLNRRWPQLLGVACAYCVAIAGSVGFQDSSQYRFVAIATLCIAIGAVAVEGFIRQCGERVVARVDRLPKLVKWIGRSFRFWAVFLLAYVGLGIAMHDLFSRFNCSQAYLY